MGNIYWYQGLFLTEAHFISLEDQIRHRFMQLEKKMTDKFWGISEIEIDRDKLLEGRLTLNRLTAIFQDGSIVESDNSRFSVLEIEKEKEKFIDYETIYICLKQYNRHNIEIYNEESRASGRYVERVEKGNLVGNQGEIEYLDYYIYILPEYKIQAMSKFMLIPITRVKYVNDRVVEDREYIPPMTDISQSRKLNKLLSRVHYQIKELFIEKSKFQITASIQRGRLTSEQLINPLIINAISDKLPELEKAKEEGGEGYSPQWLHGIMIQLISRLSYYSKISGSEYSASNIHSQFCYEHLNLKRCMDKLEKALELILRGLVEEAQLSRALTRDSSGYYLVRDINDEFFNNKEYYLVLQSERLTEDDYKDFNKKAKLQSASKIRECVKRFSSGVGLNHIPGSPAGIIPEKGKYYFEIDTDDSKWENIKRERSIGFHYSELESGDHIEVISL